MTNRLHKKQGVSLNDRVSVSVSDTFNALTVSSPMRETNNTNEVVEFSLNDVAELLGEERLEEMLESVRDDTVEVERKHLTTLRQTAQHRSYVPSVREAVEETSQL